MVETFKDDEHLYGLALLGAACPVKVLVLDSGVELASEGLAVTELRAVVDEADAWRGARLAVLMSTEEKTASDVEETSPTVESSLLEADSGICTGQRLQRPRPASQKRSTVMRLKPVASRLEKQRVAAESSY